MSTNIRGTFSSSLTGTSALAFSVSKKTVLAQLRNSGAASKYETVCVLPALSVTTFCVAAFPTLILGRFCVLGNYGIPWPFSRFGELSYPHNRNSGDNIVTTINNKRNGGRDY